MSQLGRQLISIVRDRANRYPDRIYEPPDGHGTSCQYVHADGKPGCLIGEALFAAGVIDADFYKSGNNMNTITQLARELDLSITSNELAWLAEVQVKQDRQDCWAVAIKSADERHPL